jgi:IMP dehydrogenase
MRAYSAKRHRRIVMPAFSQVPPKDTPLSNSSPRNIRLNPVLVSAAIIPRRGLVGHRDCAGEGGIGIVHKNLDPQQQAAEAAAPRYESGTARSSRHHPTAHRAPGHALE